ncbi:pyridoxal phosphate-dependent transferase [Leucosporidium creatinivorum]|uniref:Pyridoxal phosphate-dependent transferase n=1 Tax=Leucosporidium creatinivorum TaxID=106004 RepID=A0A1Y2D5Q4_9BASI|nr:pyridoxal phosphate-dependent transferase [Leucosporidium creatinivorum]
MTTPIAYKVNPALQATNSPPIPLAGAWSALYTPTPSAPLINLAQGVPGAPPPAEFQRRLAEAAADPVTTGYGDLRGDAELREKLARDLEGAYAFEEDKVDEEKEVVLTAGCNLAFYATMVSLAGAGDEIILPTPWYFNNEMVLAQLGISVVPLVCQAPSFQPSPKDCEALITEKTRAIVLVTPNNPTGAIYTDELLHEFAELAIRRGVALVLDETYREFLPSRPHTLFTTTPWRSYLIHLFSFSKSYAIPGHRLGAIISSSQFLSQLNKTLDCLQICPARPAQKAVEWAVEATREWREATRDEIAQRQKLFKELLEGVEGWEVSTGGGYFAYVKHPFSGVSSEVVASRLGQYVGITVLPGTFFSPPFANIDDDRYIRFSIANVSADTLKKVPERLVKLNELWESLPAPPKVDGKGFEGKGSSD